MDLLDAHCTFPAIEKMKLLKRSPVQLPGRGTRTCTSRNYSLITRLGKVELAPAYDFLNSTVAYLALGKRLDTIMETALPLGGQTARPDPQVMDSVLRQGAPRASRQGHRQSPG